MGPAEVEDAFSYHAPEGDQPQRYECVRSAAKLMAHVIMYACPESADRSSAIRKLRECVMTANASIALGGRH